MSNFSSKKLGRRAVKRDSRTPQLSRYFLPSLPPPPASCLWMKGLVDWGEFLNDQLGDCTIAGVAHGLMGWLLNIGQKAVFTDGIVENYYELWCGYKPGDPSTDNGGVLLDVLKDWKSSAFFGFYLNGYSYVNPSNIEEVKQAIFLFGGLYTGIQLPLSAQDQDVWSIPQASVISRIFGLSNPDTIPNSWGSHCIWTIGYDEDYVYVITWGQVMKMTWAFWLKYVDESYALLSPTWLTIKGSPSGFDLNQLTNYLSSVR